MRRENDFVERQFCWLDLLHSLIKIARVFADPSCCCMNSLRFWFDAFLATFVLGCCLDAKPERGLSFWPWARLSTLRLVSMGSYHVRQSLPCFHRSSVRFMKVLVVRRHHNVQVAINIPTCWAMGTTLFVVKQPAQVC